MASKIKRVAPEHFQERAHFKEAIIYQVYPASYVVSVFYTYTAAQAHLQILRLQWRWHW